MDGVMQKHCKQRMNSHECLEKKSPFDVSRYTWNPGVKQAKIKTSERFAKGEITDEIKGIEAVPFYKVNNRRLFAASLLVEFEN